MNNLLLRQLAINAANNFCDGKTAAEIQEGVDQAADRSHTVFADRCTAEELTKWEIYFTNTCAEIITNQVI